MQISVAYLLSQMPAPSEEFLAVEVNFLIRAGLNVTVFCLREPHPQNNKLIVDQALSGVRIHYIPYLFSWHVWRKLGYWLRRNPTILWHMVALITRTCWRRPRIWFQSLATLPKSFSIAHTIQQEEIKIVHAAWGHYPAITALLIQRLIPSVQFTLALGALRSTETTSNDGCGCQIRSLYFNPEPYFSRTYTKSLA